MNSPSSTPDDALKAFQTFAEGQAAATVKLLVEQAARPALAELEAFRAALDARAGTLAATIGGAAAAIDDNPIQELVERLKRAAGEEAATAAQAARTVAIQEADARLERDRAEAQKQLDAMRQEAADERSANQKERNTLADALAQAKEQADAMRADRDAQLSALARAREQADEVRKDRDAQLEALRAAQEQANALRAERDAQIDALRVAAEQVAAISAERDTHMRTAEAATSEARTVQGQQDALLEAARISNVRHAKLLEQAQERSDASQAQAVAARAQATEAQARAEAAQAQLSAAQAQAEAAQAQLVVAQAQLAEAQDQLAAAQAEAERRLAIGASEIEALRLELERVRASMQAARVEPVAVAALPDVAHVADAAPAVAPVEIHAVEVPSVFEPATVQSVDVRSAGLAEGAEPATFAPVLGLVEPFAQPEPSPVASVVQFSLEKAVEVVNEPSTHPVIETTSGQVFVIEQTAHVSEPEPVQLHAVEPEPVAPVIEVVPVLAAVEPEPVQEVDSVGAMYRAISGAADLSQVLDALIDGVGALFPRAALFVVKTKSKKLQGWRSVGFTGVAAITREFEFPLTTDSALTRAVTASRTIFTGEGQPGAQAGEAWTVTFPVTTGGRVVAVVHADGGGRTGEAPAFDRETALDLAHTLVRMGGERIGALTMSARAAFGNVMNVTPAEAAPVVPVEAARANGAANGAHVNVSRATAAPLSVVPAVEPVSVVPAEEDDAAERYAAQLVSEINRYAQASAPADRTLQERLAGKIEDANAAPPAQAPAAAPAAPVSALGLFDEALSKMLANGGLEQTSVAV